MRGDSERVTLRTAVADPLGCVSVAANGMPASPCLLCQLSFPALNTEFYCC